MTKTQDPADEKSHSRFSHNSIGEHRENIRSKLALTVVFSCCGMISVILIWAICNNKTDIINSLTTSLIAILTFILGHYFGEKKTR